MDTRSHSGNSAGAKTASYRLNVQAVGVKEPKYMLNMNPSLEKVCTVTGSQFNYKNIKYRIIIKHL